MSMLTPAGMGGKYRVPGRGYVPPPRRRGLRVALSLAIVLALGLGAVAIWHFVLGHDVPGLRSTRHSNAACASKNRGPTGGGTHAVSAATTTLSPKQVTVNVYNSTIRGGLAAQVAAELRARGFAVSQVANDPTHATITGPAEVRGGPAGAGQLRMIMAQVADASQHADTRQDASVDLVLGNGFQALRDPAQANAALAPATPTKAAQPRPHC